MRNFVEKTKRHTGEIITGAALKQASPLLYIEIVIEP